MTDAIKPLENGSIEIAEPKTGEAIIITRREQQIIALLLSESNTVKDIAWVLGISPFTSKKCTIDLAHKTGVSDRISIVRWALEHGLREFVISNPELLPVSAPPVPALATAVLRRLTARDRQILSFYANGDSNEEIANKLGIALDSARAKSKDLFPKAGVKNRTMAVAAWIMTQRNTEQSSGTGAPEYDVTGESRGCEISQRPPAPKLFRTNRKLIAA